MGSDANIYSMIRPPERLPGPMDQMGAMLQLRGLMDQGDLNNLQRQKLSGDLQEEEAFKSRIADWVKAGQAGQLPAEAYAASPSRAAAFDKSRLEGTKLRGEIDKTQQEAVAKAMTMHRDQLADVTDPQTAARWVAAAYNDPALRPLAEKYGGPMEVALSKIPQDPAGLAEWVKKNALGATKFIEMNKPHVQTQDLGGTSNIVSTPGLGGAPTVLSSTPKTQTPGEVQQANQPVWDEARGVFVPRPAAAPGAPGAVVKPSGLPAKPADVHNLRNEFNALPEVKQYKDTLPIVEAARVAPDTRAGDIQLAYAVGKILDPNSVVREGELKMSADAQTAVAKYWGEMQSAVSGKGRLSPATRGELVKMLDSAVTQRETAYKQAETTYRGIAEKNGVPVDQVIITPMKRTEQPGQGGTPKLFDKMPDAAQYSGRRMQADDGTVYQSDGKRWVRQGGQQSARPSTNVPL